MKRLPLYAFLCALLCASTLHAETREKIEVAALATNAAGPARATFDFSGFTISAAEWVLQHESSKTAPLSGFTSFPSFAAAAWVMPALRSETLADMLSIGRILADPTLLEATREKKFVIPEPYNPYGALGVPQYGKELAFADGSHVLRYIGLNLPRDVARIDLINGTHLRFTWYVPWLSGGSTNVLPP